MKLYSDHGSGSCRRVLVVADHLKIKIEEIFIDLFNADQRSPEFLALNPFGQVPALVDGDVTIYEASAINLYLVDKYQSDLLPIGSKRFETLQWMFWSAEHWRQYAALLFEERIVKKLQGQPEDSKMVDFIYASIRKSAAVLDQHLATRKYVVGDHITLADFDIAATFSQRPRTKLPYEQYPNIMAWQKRLLENSPSWKKTGDRLEARMQAAMTSFGATF